MRIRIADTPQVRKPPSRRECPERLGVADYALIRTGLGAQDVTEAQQAGGPTVRRMLVGSQLRRLRVQSGISREEAGARIRASEWKIHRLENGQVGFKERDVVDLLALYGVTDPAEVEAVLDLARETKDTGWWHHYGDLLPPWFRAYVDLEQAATLIRAYEGQFVPGLLQTDDYMRAVMGGALDETPDETDRRVELRLARQALLTRPGPPRLWAVVDEGALRRPLPAQRLAEGAVLGSGEDVAGPGQHLDADVVGAGLVVLPHPPRHRLVVAPGDHRVDQPVAAVGPAPRALTERVVTAPWRGSVGAPWTGSCSATSRPGCCGCARNGSTAAAGRRPARSGPSTSCAVCTPSSPPPAR